METPEFCFFSLRVCGRIFSSILKKFVAKYTQHKIYHFKYFRCTVQWPSQHLQSFFISQLRLPTERPPNPHTTSGPRQPHSLHSLSEAHAPGTSQKGVRQGLSCVWPVLLSTTMSLRFIPVAACVRRSFLFKVG